MIGHIANLSNDDYHSHQGSYSRSGLMLFDESPFKFLCRGLMPKKQTDAMIFGTAFHTFILEPEKFIAEYIMEPVLLKLPKKVLLKNVGRTAYEAYKAEKVKIEFINSKTTEDFEELAEGKIALSIEDLGNLEAMRDSLQSHSEAWDLIQGAFYEQSFFWKDKESDLLLKCRPDILHKNMIVDLKTCVSASPRAYQRAMVDGGYHIQGAMIRDAIREIQGHDIPNVINICIEKTFPYEIGIKIIGEEALEAGRLKYRQICLALKHALVHNAFNSYPIETVELPQWAS